MEEDSGSNTPRGLSYLTPPTDTPLPPPTLQSAVAEDVFSLLPLPQHVCMHTYRVSSHTHSMCICIHTCTRVVLPFCTLHVCRYACAHRYSVNITQPLLYVYYNKIYLHMCSVKFTHLHMYKPLPNSQHTIHTCDCIHTLL